MLQQDPELFQLYKDLVVSGIVTPEEFWNNRKHVSKMRDHVGPHFGLRACARDLANFVRLFLLCQPENKTRNWHNIRNWPKVSRICFSRGFCYGEISLGVFALARLVINRETKFWMSQHCRKW